MKMFVCFSLFVSLVINWRFVQGVTCFSPYDSWERLQPPYQPHLVKKMEKLWFILDLSLMVTTFEKLAQNKALCISAGIRGEESRRIKQINQFSPPGSLIFSRYSRIFLCVIWESLSSFIYIIEMSVRAVTAVHLCITWLCVYWVTEIKRCKK